MVHSIEKFFWYVGILYYIADCAVGKGPSPPVVCCCASCHISISGRQRVTDDAKKKNQQHMCGLGKGKCGCRDNGSSVVETSLLGAFVMRTTVTGPTLGQEHTPNFVTK